MTSPCDSSLLEVFLPQFDARNHQEPIIHGPPARIYAAIRAVSADEMPLFQLLIGVRSLPARLIGGRPRRRQSRRPLLQALLAANFALLADEPEREIVIGIIGQP